ncbi:MAG TPA: hypothetical protein VK886_06660 [Vicinamibacterales bacterium]|nr:hypothetical protein [Vicinamibacterales bacterium]
MDVLLVPTGLSAHELYCEVPDPPVADTEEPPRGFIRSLRHRFHEMMVAAEHERRARLSGAHVEAPQGWWGRVRTGTLRWAAEAIAEQRLLWHLRGCQRAELGFPADLQESAARELLRAQLTRDYEKHRRWFIIDLLGFVVSGLFMLVPGPNLIAYYFAFRLVGHFLSMRGARQGLDRTEWTFKRSEELQEVRRLVTTDPPDREARLLDIEGRLRLEHFASFVRRVAAS